MKIGIFAPLDIDTEKRIGEFVIPVDIYYTIKKKSKDQDINTQKDRDIQETQQYTVFIYSHRHRP